MRQPKIDLADLPVAAFCATWDGAVLACNEEMLRVLGTSTSLAEAVGAAEWAALTDAVRRAGAVQRWETAVAAPGGPPRQVVLTAGARTSAETGEKTLEGIIVELEAPDGSGDRLLRAFHASVVGMALVGSDARPTMANAALLDLLQMDEEEFLDSGPDSFMSLEDAADARARIAAIVSGEIDSYEIERRVRRADGEEAWVIANASVVRNERGALDAVLVQYVDVTDRHRSQEALEQSQSENRALLESIPDLMFRVDADGYIRWWRPAPGVPLMMAPEQFLGRHVTEVHPDMAVTWLRTFAAVLESGESELVEYDLDLEGDERTFEAQVASIRGEELLVVIRDITDRKRLQHQLEALVQAKDELVATVSHQLRTPLTSVVGFAEELLERREQLGTPEAVEMVELIAGQAQEMADLVEDLLVAARGDVGMLTVVPERIDLATEVRGVLGVLRVGPVELHEPDGPVAATADPFRFRQIMRNLMTNAVRYGGERVDVHVARGIGGSRVLVVDDGPGLPEDEWELIFDPYYRADVGAPQPTSFGLGLTVSRMLAWLMDGDLEYHVTGGRSTFELTLPS